jgi:Domain of unknown function (DUF4252)
MEIAMMPERSAPRLPRAVPLFLLLAASTLTACSGVPAAETVRAEIEHQLPGARFEPAEHLRLGRLSLGLLHWLAGFDHDREDQDSVAMFRAISSVEIATYKVRSLPPLEDFRLPEGFEHRLREAGWLTLLRSEEKNEHTWILYRGESLEAIRDFYLVSLDPKELSLIRVSGHLDQVMARALAKEPKKMTKLAKAAPPS